MNVLLLKCILPAYVKYSFAELWFMCYYLWFGDLWALQFLCCGEWWKKYWLLHMLALFANLYKLIKGLLSLVDLFKEFGGLTHLTPLFKCTPFFCMVVTWGFWMSLNFIWFWIFLHVISNQFPSLSDGGKHVPLIRSLIWRETYFCHTSTHHQKGLETALWSVRGILEQQ